MPHPRIHFAFYSSIARRNIMPIITEMFKADEALLEENMTALFD